MIIIDFSYAVSLYLIATVAIIVSVWIFFRKQKEKDLFLDPHFIWHCAICTYIYINTQEETITVCPRCGHYNKKEAVTDIIQNKK